MNNGTQLLILFSISLLSSSCFATDSKNASSEQYEKALSKKTERTKKDTGSETNSVKKIKYTPPFLGAPSTERLHGMGVRSSEKQINLLFSVLTPTHAGLTSQSQPLLYWFASTPISQPFQFIEFVINSEESIAPILRTHLPQLEKEEIHQLNMADYNIKLKPGVEYWWSIALVKNPEARSLDSVSSGKIKYVEPATELLQKLQQSSDEQKAAIYAQSGYWYEAIATAIARQKEQPENLVQLMNQVKLQKIAKHFTKN